MPSPEEIRKERKEEIDVSKFEGLMERGQREREEGLER